MDADLLKTLRDNALAQVSGSATIGHATNVSSRLGGDKRTWDYLTVVTCDLQPISITGNAAVATEGARVSTAMVFMAYMPWDAPIKNEDRIKVGLQEYDVTGTNRDDIDRIQMEVSVKLVPGPTPG